MALSTAGVGGASGESQPSSNGANQQQVRSTESRQHGESVRARAERRAQVEEKRYQEEAAQRKIDDVRSFHQEDLSTRSERAQQPGQGEVIDTIA